MVQIRKQRKLIYGVGFRGAFPTRGDGGGLIKSYEIWASMLQRCYSKIYHKKRSSYLGCTISKDWLNYSNFKKWFDKNHRVGFHIDKDLLNENNKIYSEENCRFVPEKLNTLFLDRSRDRGLYKLGVHFDKRNGKFAAQSNMNGKRKFLGYFKTENEASLAYRKTKKRYCTIEVNKYYKNKEIERDLYISLIRRIANL